MHGRAVGETWRQAPANDDDEDGGGGGVAGSKEPVSRNTVGNGPSARAPVATPQTVRKGDAADLLRLTPRTGYRSATKRCCRRNKWLSLVW